MVALIPVCAQLNSKEREKQYFVGRIYACFTPNASVCAEKLAEFILKYLLYPLSYVIFKSEIPKIFTGLFVKRNLKNI
jgi:hypothetical protein